MQTSWFCRVHGNFSLLAFIEIYYDWLTRYIGEGGCTLRFKGCFVVQVCFEINNILDDTSSSWMMDFRECSVIFHQYLYEGAGVIVTGLRIFLLSA